MTLASVNVNLSEAPSTPLNLRIGVAYSPRVETPPWVGYACNEVREGVFEVFAYDANGGGASMFVGGLGEAWYRFATHLRMDWFEVQK